MTDLQPYVLEHGPAGERRYFEELRDTVFANAKSRGFEIVLPSPSEIQLDIDMTWAAKHHKYTESSYEVSEIIRRRLGVNFKMYGRLKHEFTILRHQAWKSSNGNCHVVLTLGRELLPVERIAIQSMLGSDPMRELLNLRRVLCGAEDPVALFMPPDTHTTEEDRP